MGLNTSNSDEKTAYALPRAVAGINLLMHRASRLIAGKAVSATHLTDAAADRMEDTGSPDRASLLMMVLTFGSSLVQDWSAAGTQLIYALVFSVLLFYGDITAGRSTDRADFRLHSRLRGYEYRWARDSSGTFCCLSRRTSFLSAIY